MHDLLENHLMVVIINVSVSVNGVRVDRVAFGVAFVDLVVVSPLFCVSDGNFSDRKLRVTFACERRQSL